MSSRLKHAIREISVHADETHWWRSRYEHRIMAPLQQVIYGDDGVSVMKQDWDNLLILDACRADLFESVFDTSTFDDYRRETSLGGSTPEWLQRNFVGGRFGDTVYVTGNPQVSKYARDAFHDVVEVWDGQFDSEHRTVLPESIVEATLDAAEQYPHKRLLAHFMQPHTPFLEREEVFPDDHGLTKEVIDESHEEIKTMVEAVGLDTVWEAYRRTLEVAVDPVERLVDALDGKTVLSSDHGELLGERVPPFYTRLYGHKTGIRHPKLVEVPWAVVDGNRRRIRDEGVSIGEIDHDKVEEQLEMLGYK